MSIREMLEAGARDDDDLTELVVALGETLGCGLTCRQCADACLDEPDVELLRNCIRTNLICAGICTATNRVLVHWREETDDAIRQQLAACLEACEDCASECRRHSQEMEHCRICAEACARCARACRRLLDHATTPGPG